MKSYKDQEILDGIRSHDHNVLNYIYAETLPVIENMIINSGGSLTHAKDVFQDAMIVVYRKIDNEGLSLHCKFTTYMYSVCRNLWLQELKYGDRALTNSIRNYEKVSEPEDASEYKNEMYEVFDDHIKDLSPDCQKILRLHFENCSIDEIMEAMEYKNTHYTIDRKYRCKQSLVKRIINDPRYIDIRNGLKNRSR
ncbi:MAG: sigma-70 family RNA polymerase sigma factor [Bacteroidales bacterium]|nr:sigma-70 family RNA polymerase sigma factor [Bacteroidales bacterium]MCF8390410.1 sigma-70 family RNA polymerase sigma factor [Bacteroidales bacterium]